MNYFILGLLVLAGIALKVVFWGSVIYVAVHFITKFW
jgi:hypothetical protein